jgi:hypothetical protein
MSHFVRGKSMLCMTAIPQSSLYFALARECCDDHDSGSGGSASGIPNMPQIVGEN